MKSDIIMPNLTNYRLFFLSLQEKVTYTTFSELLEVSEYKLYPLIFPSKTYPIF